MAMGIAEFLFMNDFLIGVLGEDREKIGIFDKIRIFGTQPRQNRSDGIFVVYFDGSGFLVADLDIDLRVSFHDNLFLE